MLDPVFAVAIGDEWMGRTIKASGIKRIRANVRAKPMLWTDRSKAAVWCGSRNWLEKDKPGFVEARVVTFRLVPVEDEK